jgi:hypothetical protein
MTDVLFCVLLASLAVNVVLIWQNFRSIRAYYNAHELLQHLCFHAWRMRERRELLPIYQRTIGDWWLERGLRK